MKGGFVGQTWSRPLATALAQMTDAGLPLEPVSVLGEIIILWGFLFYDNGI